jgi:N-acetylglucosamine kinase-like BadF-type ATPase
VNSGKQIVIGVDGGGTRLRAAIATEEGELLGIAEAGSGNYHDVGADEVRTNLGRAVSHAWADSGIKPRRADAIFLGLGSIVTEEDQDVIRTVVRELEIAPDDRIGVDHDLRVGLAGGLAGQPGIVLIAGTGSSCYGRNDQGQTWQAGGWGPILDDPGSSYWLGLQAMIASIRAHDGRGPDTILRSRVMTELGLSNIREILRRVELTGMKRCEIAALAPLVTESAACGDGVAQSLMERGADELALMIETVANRLGFGQTNQASVVVTGGLTNSGEVFFGPLRRSMQRRAPEACIIDLQLPPVLGGVLLALEMVHVPASSTLVERLAAGHSRRHEQCVA